MKLETILRALREGNLKAREAAIRACADLKLSRDEVKELLGSKDRSTFIAGLYACINGDVTTEELAGLSHVCGQQYSLSTMLEPLGQAFERRGISEELCASMLNSANATDRYFALRAWKGREAPEWLVQDALRDTSQEVAMMAARLCENIEIPWEVLDDWRQSELVPYRAAAMYGCAGTSGRWLPFNWVNEGIEDMTAEVRRAAATAAAWRRIPNQYLKTWPNHSLDYLKALAVIWNFENREKENPTLRAEHGSKRWLKFLLKSTTNRSRSVRTEATRAYRLAELPLIRDFEPLEYVYAYCANDAIVVAKIPDDAQVRLLQNGHGRASKATIVDIEGDFYGEKVGVPLDSYTTTMYRIGDEIVVEDFDMSDAGITTGFYFNPVKE